MFLFFFPFPVVACCQLSQNLAWPVHRYFTPWVVVAHGIFGDGTKQKKYKSEHLDTEKRKKILRLGYRESNPGLLREQSLLRSESQRCYRYTIPDSRCEDLKEMVPIG
ncbi:hypothetical protein B0T13DRAFT_456753 [Neurospora crassa]|nr:hypothetical protein B0T13DRAFT_456753 [Neurospora crassa]